MPEQDGLIPAAQYIRVSTGRQQYSIAFQLQTLAEYACERGFAIERTYTDGARSGLTMRRRPALKQMVADVISGQAPYRAILVYDVSRWGRFQDPDESAHYEFICRQMGMSIRYCAEPFENDGSTLSSLLKSVKRAMAAEYSRELSTKIFAGQARRSARGVRVAGGVPYGFSRKLVGRDGVSKGVLAEGEEKNLRSDSVILAPGPPEEVRTVQRIFEMYVHGGCGMKTIAHRLNSEGLRTRRGLPWDRIGIGWMLGSEAYIGTNVFGRQRRIGFGRKIYARTENWIRAEGAFEPLVSRELFDMAQAIRDHRTARFDLSDDELLRRLDMLISPRRSALGKLAARRPELFNSRVYTARFGTIRHAFKLIRFRVKAASAVELPRRPKGLQWSATGDLMNALRRRGIAFHRELGSSHVIIGDGLRLSVRVLTHRYHELRNPNWERFFRRSVVKSDVTVIVRADSWATDVRDYFLLGGGPQEASALAPPHYELTPALEPYRIAGLEPLLDRIAARAIDSAGGVPHVERFKPDGQL